MSNVPCIKEGGGNLLPLTLTVGSFYAEGGVPTGSSITILSLTALDFATFKAMGYKYVKLGNVGGYNLPANTKVLLSSYNSLTYYSQVYTGRASVSAPQVTITFTLE